MASMKRVLKFLAGFLFVLILLLGAAWGYIALRKKELIQSLTEKLQESIQGEIHIGDIELSLFHQFPRIALKLEDVYLRGPHYHEYKKDFMRLQTLFLEMDLYSLFQGKIDLSHLSIEESEVFIFKTRNGYTNLDIFKKKDSLTTAHDTTPGNKLLLSLKNLRMKNVQITFADSAAGKSFGLTFTDTRQQIHSIDSGFAISLQGPVHFGGLLFKKEKGAFLENKDIILQLSLKLLHGKELYIDSSEATLNSGKIALSGLFVFSKPMEYRLSLLTDSVDVSEGLAILAPAVRKKLSVFGASGKVATRVYMHGKAIPGVPPAITVDFESAALQARLLGKTEIEEIAVKGQYHNHMNENKLNTRDNSEIIIHTLRGKASGIPMQLQARISNFADPLLDINLNFKGPLNVLNAHLDTSRIRLSSGRIRGHISYQGKLREYVNQHLKKLSGKLSGEVSIEKAALRLPQKGLNLHSIQCRIHFNREVLNIPLLQVKTGNDLLSLRARLSGFIPFFTEPHAGSLLSVNIQTDHLDLGKLMRARQERQEKRNQLKTRKRLYNMLLKTEEMLATEIHLEARKLVHGRLQVNNAVLDVQLKNKMLKVSQARMNFAGGSIALKALVTDLPKDLSPFELETELNQVNVKDFMYAFNSFGSTHLTEKNIEGSLNARIALSGFMDNTGSVFNEHLKGNAEMQLHNGKLIQFEPIMGIGELVFMNRDFSMVEFAAIEGRASISGLTATIDRTEVSSSVIRMFLEGTHSVTQGTDMQVQIPLNNLKRRPKNLKPENVGTDKKAGLSVYLRVQAEKGKKAKISYIPFPKKKAS